MRGWHYFIHRQKSQENEQIKQNITRRRVTFYKNAYGIVKTGHVFL